MFPQWTVPLIETLGQPLSATRVRDHGDDHVHDIWETTAIDLTARKVCASCNGGWMSELEAAAIPLLRPLILTTEARTFSEEEAVTIATWVTKTALTSSLLESDDTNPVVDEHFRELFDRRLPLGNSVVWLAAYDVGRYPASSSMVPIPPMNGSRLTGNLGCLAYQVTAGDDPADHRLVLPPGELVPYLTQIWPVEPRPDLGLMLKRAWPLLGHLGRAPVAMSDEGLRFLSQVSDHSWGVGEQEPPPARA